MKKFLLLLLTVMLITVITVLLSTGVSAATDGYYAYEVLNVESTVTDGVTSII